MTFRYGYVPQQDGSVNLAKCLLVSQSQGGSCHGLPEDAFDFPPCSTAAPVVIDSSALAVLIFPKYPWTQSSPPIPNPLLLPAFTSKLLEERLHPFHFLNFHSRPNSSLVRLLLRHTTEARTPATFLIAECSDLFSLHATYFSKVDALRKSFFWKLDPPLSFAPLLQPLTAHSKSPGHSTLPPTLKYWLSNILPLVCMFSSSNISLYVISSTQWLQHFWLLYF